MIISVQFKYKKFDTYGGRKYSYFCDIDGVKVGDLVNVPAGKGEGVARVTDINVPEESIYPAIRKIMKSVISIAEDPAPCDKRSCETCDELTPIGEGDHICGADPHKMPICEYSPSDEYLWCKGTYYRRKT